MAGNRPPRKVRAPQRLGWEDDEDLGEFLMDSGSDTPDTESESESESGDSVCDSVQPISSQETGSSQATESSLTSSDSETESDVEDKDAGWVDVDTPPILPPFTGQSGVLEHLPPDSREAVDFFKLILGDDFFLLISQETNRYAAQVINSKVLGPCSRLQQWRDTTPEEMHAFVAILISMGIDDRPTYASYWNTGEIFANTFWPSIMSRDRFMLIQRSFHLTDNTDITLAGDKLRKLRPMIDLLNRRFPQLYYPNRDVCIDETMVPWTGRLSFKQYIPIKPDKFGVKIYQLCESQTGYTYKFEVYTGRVNNEVDRNHSHSVVSRLVQPLLGRGHILWVDNYYTGIPLFEELESDQMAACGTVRLNRRGIPNAVKNAKLDRGEMIFCRRGNLLALKWKDKKDVAFLTTAHTAQMINSRSRKDANGEPVLVPGIKEAYDKSMNGVDKNDQNVSVYAARRKSSKWYKKLVYHFIDLVRYQAFILFSKETPSSSSQLNFIQELILGLLEQSGLSTVALGRPRQGNPLQRLTARHFPQYVPPTEKKSNATRKCAVCCISTGDRRRRGVPAPRRKESRYQCSDCDVGLCIVPCFELYHTQKDYKRAFGNLQIDE